MAVTPSLDDHVDVLVTGQPGASKKELYFLALSAAFGVARRFDFLRAGLFIDPPPGSIMIEYNAIENWVACSLDYSYSTLSLNPVDGAGARARPIFSAAVYRGPDCEVTGKAFGFVGRGAFAGAGIPLSAVAPGAPTLAFADKIIATPCPTVVDPNPAGPVLGPTIPSPNPKPPGDNRSRGVIMAASSGTPGAPADAGPPDTSYLGSLDCCTKVSRLIPLVYSALTFPGSNSLETFPAPAIGALGG